MLVLPCSRSLELVLRSRRSEILVFRLRNVFVRQHSSLTQSALSSDLNSADARGFLHTANGGRGVIVLAATPSCVLMVSRRVMRRCAGLDAKESLLPLILFRVDLWRDVRSSHTTS